jgi:hypothetical protein
MPSFRISVWRPFRGPRALHYATRGTTEVPDDRNTAPTPHPPFDRERLHEELYGWSPSDDVWGGVRDTAARLRLREMLLAGFAPSGSPQNRQVARLSGILDELDRVIHAGEADWMPSSQQVEGGDLCPLQISPVLALHSQLIWIYETFRDMPGVCLTVR